MSKRTCTFQGGGTVRREVNTANDPLLIVKHAMEDYEAEELTAVLQQMGKALPSDIKTVKQCFETQEYLQDHKQFGLDSLEKLANPGDIGFAPFAASKMYDLFKPLGQLDAYMHEGRRVAHAMGAKPCPWLSVTFSSAQSASMHAMIPADMLPKEFMDLLPQAGFDVVLFDYVGAQHSQTWYVDKELMRDPWAILKPLGDQAKNQMTTWGCDKPVPIGWYLTIVRD